MKVRFVLDKKNELMRANHPDIKKYIRDVHKNSGNYLKNSAKMYQESWNKIGDKFSSYIKKLTRYNWFYENYTCVVSAFFKGLTNWGYAPIIVRIWDQNPDYMRAITAHELFMSHYFEIVKRNYASENLTDGQIWALAELAALEMRTDKYLVKNFWPWWIVDDIKYFGHKNIHFLWPKLHKKYIKKKDYDDYIKFGIKLIKKYPRIAPQVFVDE